MKSKLYAAALAATLAIGTSGIAMAQATPPVGDPTANSAETPKQKMDNATTTPSSGNTSTQTTGTGGASPTGGAAPSGAANTK